MKEMKTWMLAAILLCGAACVISCNGNANGNKIVMDTPEVVQITGTDAFMPVME